MTARIPLAGVLGSPVAQSRSPLLHAHWLRQYRIAGFYVPMDVAAQDFADAVANLPRLGFVGVNVTVPHKERMLALADRASERARTVGAANTIVFDAEGGSWADNTDGLGFLANLRQEARHWRADAGPAAVLGAGGAARAVIAALIEAGAPSVRIANRTRSRAEALAAVFGATVAVHDWDEAAAMLDGAATVVNTTSLGMTGKPALDIALDRLAAGAVVNDLVYAPVRTELLERASAMGATAVDGLGMLLHQAAPGFGHWFGVVPQVDAATRAAVLAA